MIKILNEEDGYVLPFLLFVSALIISLLFGIISVLFFYNSYNVRSINKKKLDLACSSAVQKFLTNEDDLKGEDIIYDIDSIKVLLQKKQRGLFWELTSTAKNSKDSSMVKSLIASTTTTLFDNALIVSKPNFKAAVTGNTKISGNMLATDNKIALSRINGIPSVQNDYLNGKVITQKNIDTKLFSESFIYRMFNSNEPLGKKTEFENFILSELNLNVADSLGTIYLSGDLVIKGNLLVKSSLKPLIFFAAGKTIIKDSTNSNAVLTIISDSTIVINNFVNLENVTLSAKGKISAGINSNFKNTQLFSQKGIEINSSAFNYPSVLLLYVDTRNTKNLNNLIDIKSSIINGSVMLISLTTGLTSNKSKIKLDSGSKLQGLLYSENNVELAGEISGILYTYGFWYYKDPTEYIDWLVNIRVNRYKLDKLFLLPVGFKNTASLEILKESWIY